MLQCAVLFCGVLQCDAVCCRVLYWVAVCVAVCCSVLQCVALFYSVCYSVLQCVAVCCNDSCKRVLCCSDVNKVHDAYNICVLPFMYIHIM